MEIQHYGSLFGTVVAEMDAAEEGESQGAEVLPDPGFAVLLRN